MHTYTYSPAGLALTKSFEGLRLAAYRDTAGNWTIGYGHTGPAAQPGATITEAQATALLEQDLAASVACVNSAVRVALGQPQFDALVDFCFNAGRGAFLGSSLLRYVNCGETAAAAAQFPLWANAGGVPSKGLLRRRNAESRLFLSDPAAGQARIAA